MKINLCRRIESSSRCATLVIGVLFFSINPTVAAEPPASAGVATSEVKKLDSVDSLIHGLRSRLEQNPNDPKGWALLAKSYHFLGRSEEYNEAMKNAKALGYKEDASSTSNVPPRHKKAQKTSGISNVVALEIANITNKPIPSTSTKGVTVKVAIHPSVLSAVSSNTAVYIFARSAAGGPPLAAVKKKVSDLPLDIVLDDSMAMVLGRNISSAKTVIVGARISLSGSPIKRDGDIEVLSEVVSSAQGNDKIVLTFE